MPKRLLSDLLIPLTAAFALLACSDDDPANAAPVPGGSAGSTQAAGGSGGATAGGSSQGGAGGNSSTSLCGGVAEPCVAFAAGSSEAQISEALVSAAPNTTFVFDVGTFAFTNTLSIATAGVTVRGQGMDKTILDFKGQIAGAQGLSVQEVDDFTMQDIKVRDTKGDGVKIAGGKNITLRRLEVEFTAPEPSSRGAYGIYPVQCDNVLIEECVAIGASDAGIYVGQSRTILVRKNTAKGNVAGIEIENCYNADVTENLSTENVGGVLVFDLPGLPQLGGHDVRVFKNQIIGNNTKNFAPAGNIVGSVPAGTGVLVMANKNVEVFDNDIKNNNSAAFAVASYAVALKTVTDPKYYQWPQRVHVHDNRFENNGTSPDTSTAIGGILSDELLAAGPVPDLVFDGADDPNATSEFPGNPLALCFRNNTTGTPPVPAKFVDLAFPKFGAEKSFDLAPYTCDLTPVTPVTLPAK